MIGNNVFFATETGVEAAAAGGTGVRAEFAREVSGREDCGREDFAGSRAGQ